MNSTTRRRFLALSAAIAASGFAPLRAAWGQGAGETGAGDAGEAAAGGGTAADARVLAIDVHAHLPHEHYGGPLVSRFSRAPRGDVAEKETLARLAEAVTSDSPEAVAAILLEQMDAWGVEKTCLLPIDFGYAADEDTHWAEMEAVGAICAARPDRLIAFFGCDPRRGAQGIERLERAKTEFDVRGVKVHPLAGFAVDDESLYPFYRRCAELGLPVLGHCRPIGLGPRDDLYRPARYAKLAGDLPELQVCLGHMGAMDWREEALDVIEAHENAWGDISFYQAADQDGQNVAFEFLDRALSGPGRERIMFGTDWPNSMAETEPFLEAIRSGGRVTMHQNESPTEALLDEEEVRLLLRENARRFLNL